MTRARHSDRSSTAKKRFDPAFESVEIMPDYLDSVKLLAHLYRKLGKDSESDNVILSKRHIERADHLDSLISEVEMSRERLRSVTNALGDLSDLPPEVLAELSVTKLDELEQQLRDIVASGDEVGLDAVIVELYRRHKIVHPRRFVMNKLYRMAQKGLIRPVEGKKGAYTVNDPRSSSAGFVESWDEEESPF